MSRVGERAVLWDPDARDAEALLSRRELAFTPPGGGEARPLEDPYLSRRPIRLSAARFGGIRIDCTRSGTRVIANEDWISEDRVYLGVEVERGVVLVLSERLALLLHNLGPDHAEEVPRFGLVGDSSPIRGVRREIERLARQASPVVFRGASGSGKKAAARAIHDAGRQNRPCVTIHLGDEEVAPTVADVLAEASGGTLVLDAVDRMETELQAQMLRALGENHHQVRLLATGGYPRPREAAGPLIEKLEWNTVEIPPLSSRRDDVGRLVVHFMREELEKLGALRRLDNPGPYAAPWLPVRLVATLAAYEWPSNVRQLRRVTVRLARDYHDSSRIDASLDVYDLLEEGSETSSTGWGWSYDEPSGTPASSRPSKKLSEIEVLSALRTHRWQAEPAAAHLGISPETLFAIMEKFFDRGHRR